MSRKPYSWLVVVGMISLCIGLSGCGKNVDTVAESTVPIEIGEHVMYGSYQGEPVEWRVLDKKDGEILLLSEYGLDILPFDDSGSGSIIWENSSIRNWLNNEFYNSTFSKEEQENILVSAKSCGRLPTRSHCLVLCKVVYSSLVRGRFSDHHKVGFLTISRTVFRLYEGRTSGHQLV